MRNKTSAKAHCYAQTKLSIIQINWIRSDWNEPATVAALVTMLHWLLAVLGNHIYIYFFFLSRLWTLELFFSWQATILRQWAEMQDKK